MKKKKLISVLFLFLISNVLFSQENLIEFKTTDIYLIELPTSGEYYNKAILTEWKIDLKSKIISYKRDEESFDFYYINDELVKNENGEISIRFENKSEEIYFSSFSNYFKLIHYSKMKPLSAPRSYKMSVTYVNYEIDDIFEIMNYNIN